jgi:hypothetical protein
VKEPAVQLKVGRAVQASLIDIPLEAKELSAHSKGEVVSPQYSVLSFETED